MTKTNWKSENFKVTELVVLQQLIKLAKKTGMVEGVTSFCSSYYFCLYT